jgi:hypothetical protein
VDRAGAGAFGLGGWEQALGTTGEPMTGAPARGAPSLLVLDEFPYLKDEAPGFRPLSKGGLPRRSRIS